jgi:hypothetical protein
MAGRHLFERLKTERWSVIDELVNEGTPETLHLDFKQKGRNGAPGKLDDDDRKNLAKTISAFANTDGGLIIFGIGTSPGSGSRPDCASSKVVISQLGAFAKTVESILRDVVNPAVARIELEPVETSKGSDEGALGIYIPQSSGGPHRANMGPADVREHYYQRSASRSDIMPHSMLSALFGRRPEPRLQLRWRFDRERDRKGLDQATFALDLVNSGRGTARRPAIRFVETKRIRDLFADEPRWHEWAEVVRENAEFSSGWNRPRTAADGVLDSFIIEAKASVIIYPGEAVPVILRSTRLPGIARLPFVARGKGAIYAVDAQPVLFDESIECLSWNDPILMPREIPT